MAYKFNSGRGGVICDNCRVLIDSDLSLATYEEVYGKDGNNGDFCWRCKSGYNEKKGKSAIIGSRLDSRSGGGKTLGGSSPSSSGLTKSGNLYDGVN